MSVLFGYTMSLIDAATPSNGWLVAYDSDGVLKQKGQDGIITSIGTGAVSSSGTPSISQIMQYGNNTGVYSLIMGTSTSISSARGSGQLNLDFGSSNSVRLTNGTNTLQLSGTTNSISIPGSTFSISNEPSLSYGNLFRISGSSTTGKTLIQSSNEIDLKLSWGSTTTGGGILIKRNNTISGVTSEDKESSAIIIGSRKSNIAINLNNTVIIGGTLINATQSNSVYVPDLYIQNGKSLRTTSGSGFIKIDSENNIINSTNKSLIAILSSTNSNTITSNGILVRDTSASVSSPNISSSVSFISTQNSTFNSGVFNSAIIGGIGILGTQSNTIYLGGNVNVNGSYFLPSNDGSTGQYLSTDGSGNLYWSTTSESQTLKDVLSNGNESDAYNIILGTATSLLSNNSDSRILLDYGSSNTIMLATDASFAQSYVQINEIDLNIYAFGNLDIQSDSSSISVSNGRGLVYSTDYYSSFTTHSLIDKNYVDLGTASIWSELNGVVKGITAGNGLITTSQSGYLTLDVNVGSGLQINSDTVILGGTLSQNTNLNTIYDLTIQGTGSIYLLASYSTIKSTIGDSYTEIQSAGFVANMYYQNTNTGETFAIQTDSQGISLTSDNGLSQIGGIYLRSTNGTISDGSNDNRLVIIDDVGQKGLVYDNDYSNNFSNNSLVTKEWVLNNTTDKYSIVTGFTSSITQTITHNLGTEYVIVQSYDSTGEMIIPGTITVTGVNTVDIVFSSTLSNVKIVIIG
jgi:hypothetical protein